MGVGLVEKGADSIEYTAYNDSNIGTCGDGNAEAIMPVLNIRNLPAEVHARLRIRSARAGRSMETEARAILAVACICSAGLGG